MRYMLLFIGALLFAAPPPIADLYLTSAPTGACTNGSRATNTSGTAGTNLYTCAGSVWALVGAAVTAGPSGLLTVTPDGSGGYVVDGDGAFIASKSSAGTWPAAQTYEERTFYTPSTAQTISAVSDSINCNATLVQVNPSSTQYQLTSTPSIVAGTSGQRCAVSNTGTAPISLLDESVLASTTIEAADDLSVIIPGGGMVEFMYVGSKWREMPNASRNKQAFSLHDEFCGNDSYGLTWYRYQIAGESGQATATTPCIGAVRVLDSNAYGSLRINQIHSDMYFVWRSAISFERVTTNDNWQFGLSSDPGNDAPAEAIRFERSGTDWIGTCITGSTPNSTSTIVAQATSAKTFTIRRVTSTSIAFSIDGTTATIASGCPSAQLLQPYFGGKGADSSYRSMRMDWFALKAPVNR